MFQVTNTSTFQSWTAASRDELLAELELANAKRLPLAPAESYDIVWVDEDGQIVETARVDFPLEGTIDAILEHFGQEDKTTGKLGVFKRLWPSFRNKEKASADTSTIEEVSSPQDGMQELLAMTQQTENQEAMTTLPPSSTRLEEDFTEPSENQDYSDSTEDRKVVTTTLPPEVDSFEKVSSESRVIPEVEQKRAFSQDEQVVMTTLPPAQKLSSKVEPRGLESLSTYDLQLEFGDRVRIEVSHIDQEILELEAQISQLKKKRGSHLKLLETINTLQLA